VGENAGRVTEQHELQTEKKHRVVAEKDDEERGKVFEIILYKGTTVQKYTTS